MPVSTLEPAYSIAQVKMHGILQDWKQANISVLHKKVLEVDQLVLRCLNVEF